MSFNPDHKKQAQYVSFSQKSKTISHPQLVSNNNNVIQTISQKHLGITFDTCLSFEKHLESVLCKINKTIDLICKLQNLWPRTALITSYKAFFSSPPWLWWYYLWSSPQRIVLLEIRVTSIQCLFSYYWSNTQFIKRETIPRTRFWIFTTMSLV